MWLGPIQSVEGLKRKSLRSLEKEGTLPPDCLRTWAATSTFPWVSSLLACPVDFGLASLYNHGSQFLKLNLCPVGSLKNPDSHTISSYFLENFIINLTVLLGAFSSSVEDIMSYLLRFNNIVSYIMRYPYTKPFVLLESSLFDHDVLLL